jgi:hypothetical protein
MSKKGNATEWRNVTLERTGGKSGSSHFLWIKVCARRLIGGNAIDFKGHSFHA